MNAHELGFTAFLEEPSLRRVWVLLELGAKRREDVRALLDHAIRLDQRYAEQLSGSDNFAEPSRSGFACSVRPTPAS